MLRVASSGGFGNPSSAVKSEHKATGLKVALKVAPGQIGEEIWRLIGTSRKL